MCAFLVLFGPFPLGYLLPSRTAATVVYVAAFGPLFAFQTLLLITDWAEGSTTAFGGPFPTSDLGQVVGYGGVNLILYLVGFGLLVAGARVAAARRTRRPSRQAVVVHD